MLEQKYNHPTQDKLLKLLETTNVNGLSLRKIGEKIGVDGSAQKILFHIKQLEKRGLVNYNPKLKTIKLKEKFVYLPIVGTIDV